jgi:hypothetical protein
MIADDIVEKFYPGSTSKFHRALFPEAAKRDRLNAALMHFGFRDLLPDEDVTVALNALRKSCMSAEQEAIIIRLLAQWTRRDD